MVRAGSRPPAGPGQRRSRRRRSSRSIRPWSSTGSVVAMITPKIAPASARTATSSGSRPLRLARTAAVPSMVRANSSRARARISGTAMVSSVVCRNRSRSSSVNPARAAGHGAPHRGQRAQPGRLRLQRVQGQHVQIVLQDHVFLGREVPVERGRGHLGRLGDLLNPGSGVPLLAEQPQRVLPDGGTRPGFLALPQPGLVSVVRAHALDLARPAPAARAERRTRPSRPGRRGGRLPAPGGAGRPGRAGR